MKLRQMDVKIRVPRVRTSGHDHEMCGTRAYGTSRKDWNGGKLVGRSRSAGPQIPEVGENGDLVLPNP